LEERLARNAALQAEHAALIGDLILLTTEPALVTVPPSGDTVGNGDTAGPLSSPSPLRGGSVVKLLQAPALAQEHAQFRAQQHASLLAETKARSNLARYTKLEARGIATRQELENARYEAERLQAESRLHVEQVLARWQSRLRDERAVLAGLEADAQRLAAEQALHVVRAPAEGQLIGFNGWSPGTFVPAGQSLGFVSPNAVLQIETRVPSRDAGLLRVGQPARLQIDAFPYTAWGMLEGKITSISGDLAIHSPGGEPAFQVFVQPAASFLALPNGARGELRKGLALTARFLVTRRSVLQLLYEDASSWLDPQGNSTPRATSRVHARTAFAGNPAAIPNQKQK
jgi:HlyD family secretion protein